MHTKKKASCICMQEAKKLTTFLSLIKGFHFVVIVGMGPMTPKMARLSKESQAA
jgi:hypothetical protein